MNDQKLYYLSTIAEHENHDTACCCSVQTALPHEVYGARIYQLDGNGLQALWGVLASYDKVSFNGWLAASESQGTYYGASEAAAIDAAIIQARKQGMLLVNYPQKDEEELVQKLPVPYLMTWYRTLRPYFPVYSKTKGKKRGSA